MISLADSANHLRKQQGQIYTPFVQILEKQSTFPKLFNEASMTLRPRCGQSGSQGAPRDHCA